MWKLLIGAMLALSTIAFPALAELGGDVTSVQNDQNQFKAQRRATVSNGYTVHELQIDSGIVVREYINADGAVFAVTWRGPFMPNLQQLLGRYFSTFKTVAANRRAAGARGPVFVQQDDLVAHSGGHMRGYSGRAYVPSLVPPQVSIDEIQ